jgi:hypothetical protein
MPGDVMGTANKQKLLPMLAGDIPVALETLPQLKQKSLSWTQEGRTYVGIVLVLFLFAVVYSQSLTFVYVEGDDATSIAYHAFGRKPDLQPPYSAYQSMMDGLLALLPASEKLVRVTALCLVSLGPPLVSIFITLLAFEWTPGLMRIQPWIACLLVPLLVPELFYLGLVYTPAILALAAVLGAHLWVRRRLISTYSNGRTVFSDPGFLLSAVLFGVGAAFRWDVLAYGGLIVVDIWLGTGLLRQRSKRPGADRFRAGLFWGALALSSWVASATLNGYGPFAILKTVRESGPLEHYPELAVFAATIQPFTTPGIFLFGLIGCIVLFRYKHRLILILALSLILAARFLPFGVPKWFLIAVPPVIVCSLVGFCAAWNGLRQQQGTRHVVRLAMILLVLAPWLFGFHVSHGDSAYGPGFEIKPFDHTVTAKQNAHLVIGPGALVPTSEGPRALGGHAWVLLGGGWRKIGEQGAAQISQAVQEALERKLPLLMDEQQGFAAATLLGMQFTTHDSWNRTISPRFLIERRFASRDGKRQIRVMELKKKEKVLTAEDARRLQILANSDTLVMYAYTSTLRRYYKLSPVCLEKVGSGTNTALLHLDRLPYSPSGSRLR